MDNNKQSHLGPLWVFFINRFKITQLVLLGLFFLGFGALLGLPLESNPEIKIPIATVTTSYPGAAPSDVEELVTNELEEELINIENLDSLSSTSSQGLSSIIVQFEANADIDESLRKLRDAVSKVEPSLPADAVEPFVAQINIDDRPILSLSVLSELPLKDVKSQLEELEDLLEEVKGVSGVEVSGFPRREIQVLVDRAKLEGMKLQMGAVVNALNSQDVDLPLGTVEVDELTYQLSVKGKIESLDDIRNVPIGQTDGEPLKIGDIAEVREVFAEELTLSTTYQVATGTTTRGVGLAVMKETGANVTQVADTVRERALAYADEVGDQLDVLVTLDLSTFVREDVVVLANSGLQTVLIIVVILFLALGLKESLLVGASIPFIYFCTFLILSSLGYSLNGLVLFSLILSLGIVVDTAIIMMEGIHDELEKGRRGKMAAFAAIRTYRGPLISGTLTTISAFFPMLLMTGITGEYVKFIPITISITLLGSLFIALFMVPAVSAQVFRKRQNKKAKKPYFSRFIVPLRAWYIDKLARVLKNRKKRRGMVLAMVVAFFVTIMFPAMGLVRTQLFPVSDINFFYVDVELPKGTNLQVTSEAVREVEEIVKEIPGLDNIVTRVGNGSQSGTNTARLNVNLVTNEPRPKSYDITSQLRERFASYTKADVEITELAAGPPVGAPIEVRVIGTDVNAQEEVAKDVASFLRNIEGTVNVTDSITIGTGEYHFSLNREKLEELNMSPSAVARELRYLVYGNDSFNISRFGEDLPVNVKVDYRRSECTQLVGNQVRSISEEISVCPNIPRDVAEITSLLISTPRGETIPLGEIATVTLEPSITAISHVDTETVVFVRADVEKGTVPPLVVEQLELAMKDAAYEMPEGIRLDFGGETQSTTESFESLGNAMIIGILAIAVILVLQFNSFRQPFIILLTLPMALIGVFLGLALIGRNFSFPSFIGVVALMGVVVNDAIVLIDRMNKNRQETQDMLEAVVMACRERLQPVLLTTFTTAFGVLPLAFADELWGDLAWTMFFGLLFATVLTLFLVPILYTSFYRPRQWRWGRKKKNVMPEKPTKRAKARFLGILRKPKGETS